MNRDYKKIPNFRFFHSTLAVNLAELIHVVVNFDESISL